MEGMYLRTNNPIYEAMTKFWVKIFGITFAMGVASGIVMEFQFGTNWSAYSRFVGDVFGSALAAEGIFAFFLESGFLAILLFGWDRVSKRVHFFATLMVCLGSIFSAIWIVVANSWQQTPAGFHLVQHAGMTRAEVTDFWQVIFNPSSMIRLSHVLLGAFIQGAFFVISVSAFYLLTGRHQAFARRCITIALLLAAASSSLQLVTGHFSGQMVARQLRSMPRTAPYHRYRTRNPRYSTPALSTLPRNTTPHRKAPLCSLQIFRFRRSRSLQRQDAGIRFSCDPTRSGD
jgi:cytochrome d ubiquinol oxidase subunit I